MFPLIDFGNNKIANLINKDIKIKIKDVISILLILEMKK